jgi:hypothetical protein
MRIRQQGNAATETDGGTCIHVAIDNTLYDNITLHPDWDGGLQPPGRLAVCMVDIAELIAHPCGNIANQLTVLFTAAHPNLDPNGVSIIVMTGPGGPFAFTLPRPYRKPATGLEQPPTPSPWALLLPARTW